MTKKYNLKEEFNKQKKSIFDNIISYLENKFDDELTSESNEFKLDQSKIIANNVLENIETWISNELPQQFQNSIILNFQNKNWDELIDAFFDKIEFGTSSIRGKTIPGTDLDELEKKFNNISNNNSIILHGTNTINEVNISNYTYGLVNYMKNSNMSSVVIGYDNRISSKKFANIVSKIFILNDLKVYIFDEPNPLPELVFAIQHINADLGIEITASHNDKIFNGYKIVTKKGAPPNNFEKNKISKFILNLNTQTSIKKISLDYPVTQIKHKNLIKLYNFSKTHSVKYDIGRLYVKKLKELIFDKKIIQQYAHDINVGYSSLHGTGFNIVSNLLDELKIKHFDINQMIFPHSTFPTFPTFQMLDPGEIETAKIVFENFIQEYGTKKFKELDALLYNDPDADRLGIIINNSESGHEFFGDWKLLSGNELWSLLLWYILEKTSQLKNISNDNLFVVKSLITSDTITSLCRNSGIKIFDGQVGFSSLSQIALEQINLGKINLGIFEESNGFTIAGNPNIQNYHKSHFLEKDGILAIVLVCELLAFLKSKNFSISEFLNKLYIEKKMDCFVTSRTQIPNQGMFHGVIGDIKKKSLFMNIEKYADNVLEKLKLKESVYLSNIKISDVKKITTGKYDEKFWKGFPDEGIRFYLDSKFNHITIRNSGTESKIRIFIQYQVNDFTEQNFLEKKIKTSELVKSIENEIREKIFSNAF